MILKTSLVMTGLSLLMACAPSAIGEVETSSPSPFSNQPATVSPESPLDPSTPTAPIISTTLPTPAGQLLHNADFESGTGNWEPRIGDFLHTTSESHSGLGSGRLVTSELDARGDYSALVGQCVPLTGGSAVAGEAGFERLEIIVYINASMGGTYISLSGVFTDDEQCRGAQVGTFSIPVDQGEGWVVVNGVIDVPAGASSLDFLISCAGDGPDAGILVDDVHLFPQDLP